MRTPRLHLFCTSVAAACPLAATPFDERVELLFRPPVGEFSALSPDGRRVAFTAPSRGELTLVLLDLETPGAKRTLKLDATRDPPSSADQPPPQLNFLRWATADRLVYAPAERIVPLPPITGPEGRAVPNPDGPTIVAPIFAADADGRERGALVDARDFQETPAEAVQSLADLLRTPQELAARRTGPIRWRMPHLTILGFHPRDREQLILGTHGAYSMPRQHLVDLRTGHVRAFGDEWPAPPGEPHVYDWFRLKVVGERAPTARPAMLWRDDDLDRVQRALAAKFPRRVVELLDWSDTRTRVLFRVTGGSDAGRVFVYQRTEDLVAEIFRRAPWLEAAALHPTRWIDFTTPDGSSAGSYLTSPRRPPTTPPPLLVLVSPETPRRALPAFDPEAQVFAELGFAVARLHHQDAPGLRAEDLPAWRTVLDRLAAAPSQPALFLTAPGRSLAGEIPPAQLRAGLGRQADFVSRDGADRDPSPSTRSTAYRRLGDALLQRLNLLTAPSGRTEDVK